jgi:outer membrane protein assembly factor BamB
MTMKRLSIIGLALFLAMGLEAQEATRWRGPSGNGIYPETGLLKQWPGSGPEILWSYEELGQGHSSAAVAQGFIFTTGMIDGQGYLFKFNMDGGLVWKKNYGPEFTESFYGTRGTPVIAGEKVYVESGMGQLVCMGMEDGAVIWSKGLFTDFDGKNIRWGVNETPVVDGDLIYATPGGKTNNVIALNRHSGELVWSCKGKGELSAYCTPLLFEHRGRKILATHTASHLLGMDAATGELLWAVRQPNEWSVHANTPLYADGHLFYFSGYGQGGGLVKLSSDGSTVTKVWFRKEVDSRMGGAVLLDGHLYLSGDEYREWRAVEWLTGKDAATGNKPGKGVIIYADGMFYCYSDRGELALVKGSPSSLEVVSQTKVTLGSEQHWAHPMIQDGVLYLRHGKALVAYRVS